MTSAPHGSRRSDARNPRWRGTSSNFSTRGTPSNLSSFWRGRFQCRPPRRWPGRRWAPTRSSRRSDRAGWAASGSPGGATGASKALPRSSCSTRASWAVPEKNVSGGKDRSWPDSAIPTSRTSSTRACRRAASPSSCSSGSRASPIDRYCETHDLGVEKRLGLFLDVLEAVAHAHANLIVHRDIKPSNVLVANGRTGEAPRFRHREASRGGSRHAEKRRR